MFIQNLKKDKSIILSIFLFLILSFSTMLGIFNFSVNFKSGLPNETFNKQKMSASVLNENFRWDFGTGDEEKLSEENYFVFNEPTKEQFKENIIKDGFDVDIDKLDDILHLLFNKYSLNPLDDEFLNENVMQGKKDEWIKFIEKISPTISSTSLFIYFFNNYILNEINKENKYVVYEDVEYKLGNQLADQKYVMYLNEQNPISKDMINRAMADKNNLEFTEDVIYTTNYTARKNNYKIGEKIELAGKSNVQNSKEFTFGGTFSEANKLITFRSKEKDIYFINSFNGIKDDYKYLSTYGVNLYNGDVDNIKESIFDDLKPFLDQRNIDSNFSFWISTLESFSAYYQFYIAMTVLFLSLFFLLLALNVLLSFFMIKELILKSANSLLFLKAMGYKNIELAFMNSLSILTILLPTFILAVAGQFLVQFIFSNMIQSYLEIFWSWSTISAWTFPFLILLILLNLLFFVVLNTMTISKIKLRENKVVKSNKLFNSISSLAFRRNINLGIGVHLHFKNFAKIFTTFIISFLIMGFMFVTFGFSVSVEQGGKRYAWNYGNYNSGSYFQAREMNEISEDKFEESIIYTDESLDETKNLAEMKLEDLNELKDLTGYYLYRNDLEEFINSLDGMLIDSDLISEIKIKIKEFISMYDNVMSTQFDVHKFNFLISFGEYHYYENDEIALKVDIHNDNNDYYGKVVAVDKTNEVYKNMFAHIKGKYDIKPYVDNENFYHIPIIASADYASKKYQNTIDSIWKMTNFDDSNGVSESLRKDNTDLRFKLDVIEYKSELFNGNLFMRRDDINSYLEWTKQDKNISDYNKAWVNSILDNKLNNYIYSKEIIPSALKQIVIPKNGGEKSINENYKDEIYSMSKDVNKTIKLDLLVKMVERMKEEIRPMLSLMQFLLGVSFLIFFVILIFIVIMMTNENFELIRTMGYLGYSRHFIGFNLMVWYITAFAFAELFSVLFSMMLLKIISNDFVDIMKMSVSFSFEWENILAIVLLFITLITLVVALVSHNMTKIVRKQRIE